MKRNNEPKSCITINCFGSSLSSLFSAPFLGSSPVARSVSKKKRITIEVAIMGKINRMDDLYLSY